MKDLVISGGGARVKSAATPDSDYAAWLLGQAQALRQTRPEFLDWQNLAEELERRVHLFALLEREALVTR